MCMICPYMKRDGPPFTAKKKTAVQVVLLPSEKSSVFKTRTVCRAKKNPQSLYSLRVYL